MALATNHFLEMDELDAQAEAELASVDDLSRRCGEETSRYMRREPSISAYGFELFRRAIVEHDDAAWAAVHARYVDLVRYWLGRWSNNADEVDEGVAMAFERFWRAVDTAKFARFGSLAAVLQYLKKCAYTSQLDRERAARSRPVETAIDELTCVLPDAGSVEQSVAARLDRPNIWRTVYESLGDERERLVVYLSYGCGLKPQDIWSRHSTRFQDISEIYRLKRAALEHLRRADAIQNLM